MNGAITLPCVNTNKIPIKTRVKINGANQYFLRTLKKSKISFIRSKKASILKNFL